jgi:hypothetical protein
MIAKVRIAVSGITSMALLALALLVTSDPLVAQPKKQASPTQQQPDEPTPNAMKMAREILDLKNSGELFAPMVPGVIERIRLMHLQTNPNLRKQLDEVAGQLRKAYEPRTEELMNDISWLYASRFSETELKEILVFYRSPTGKKVIDLEPKVFDDAMLGLKDWQDKFGEEVLGRFRAEMKKRGHDL